MATTKSSPKGATAKLTPPAPRTAQAKVKPAVRPEPAAKPPRKAGAAKAAGVVAKAPRSAGSAKAARPRAEAAADISADQRRHYIEIAAYYIAERRGFAPGNPGEDWAQAEAEIERLLAAAGPKTGRETR